MAALAVATAIVLSGDDEGGVSHPDEWDPRVLELVDFVQDERGLLYEHPVAIDFLTAEEYTDRILEREELTDEDVEDLEQAESELRAMGLVTGDVDLVEALRAVQDEGTLAYYDQDEDRIIIRGTQISPALTVTLVHELTHALQDQHFDLDREDESEDGADEDVFRSLVEGDATRIEDGYVASLSDEERAKYVLETASQEESTDLERGAVCVARVRGCSLLARARSRRIPRRRRRQWCRQ